MKIQADFPNEEIYVYFSDTLYPFSYFEAGVTCPMKDYEIYYDYRNFYSFEYVYSGKGTIRYKEHKFECNAGDFYVLPPGHTTHFIADNDDPWGKIWCFMPDNMFCSGLLSAYNISSINLYKGLNSPLKLEEIFELVKNKCEHPDTPRKIERLLFDMILSLADAAPKYRGEMPLSEQIKTYIEENIRMNISVDKICNEFFISQSKLFRLFIKSYNVSPTEYIKNQKTELAKRLLTNTSMSINEISEYIGFLNTSSFSNMFFKNVGMYPKDFKKSVRKSSVPKENT